MKGLEWFALSLLSLGTGSSFFLLLQTGFKPAILSRYERWLDTEFRALFLVQNPNKWVRYQLMSSLLVLLFVFSTETNDFLLLIVLVWVFPFLWIRSKKRKRTQELEMQLDGWLSALANSLRASPSLGDAIASTVAVTTSPIQQEISLMVKEQHLGTPLATAMENFGQRSQSRSIRSALAMLLVAQRSGGNLPSTLERSAASLREMARLEGVVRTKTAEGKTQAWVLALAPFIAVGLNTSISPDVMDPLFSSWLGNVVLTIALALWASSIVLTQKILAVDL